MIFMDSREFRKKLLKIKMEKAVEIVYLVCKKYDLPIPKINFDGCSLETEDELAHYHPDQDKICISEVQLHKLKTIKDVEDTIYHELAHKLEHGHGGEFTHIKTGFQTSTWRPPPGVVFISGERVLERERELIEQEKKKRASTKRQINKKAKKVIEPRQKESVDVILEENPFSDKELEEINKKVYADYPEGYFDFKTIKMRKFDKRGKETKKEGLVVHNASKGFFGKLKEKLNKHRKA